MSSGDERPRSKSPRSKSRRRRVRVALALGGALVAAYAVACLVYARRHPAVERFREADIEAPLPRVFPEGFLWGTATAAHQIEGESDLDDWSTFEREPGRAKHGEAGWIPSSQGQRVADDMAAMPELS